MTSEQSETAMNQCDRCGATLNGGVLDSQDGESIHVCGWMCWAKWRFGTSISDREAALKALDHGIQTDQASRFLEHLNNDQ